MNMISKQVEKRGKTKFFLLGKDEEGIRYWLVEPSWDCDWYWGFGYVQTMQCNHRPSVARDIDSHQHVNGMFWDRDHYSDPRWVDAWKEWFQESTLTQDEQWEFFELMRSAYVLGEVAELYNRGGAHVSANPLQKELQRSEEETYINTILLPKIFKEIEKLLTPERK